ncbi:MAG: PilC/PilY family type IV pilus protein [Azoarcus sp.]|nr:PilC/PilY family type IV pilus protein [Azoarcus sp.]
MGFNANGMKQYYPATDTFSSECVGGTGGCLMMRSVPLNTTTKPLILDWIRNWRVSGNSDYVIKGNNTANGAVMQETWAYFFGKTGVSGRNYADIAPPAGCAGKYVIFVGNAYRNNATPGDGTNEANSPRLPLIGTSATVLKRADPAATDDQKAILAGTLATSCGTSALSTAEGSGIYALNWANYMRAQGVTTYSIGVLGPTCNAEYAAHLTKLGAPDVGGGKYFATTSFEELKIAISTALSEIQSVNSAFASVSLPVSVNTQGTYLNQVYIGMFRAAENFLPRWVGNLKQYRLGYSGGELKLLDAQGSGEPAISGSGSGFIAECAVSYWTPVNTDAYWTSISKANCIGFAASSNTPDGNIVEKGGQGYLLRGSQTATSISRNAKTCDADCSGTLADFNTANSAITKTALGNASMTDAERTNLINWARGLNNKADEFHLATAMRPSVHGDVVHSRPVAINYGTDASPDVVVFYGANDGFLRAINGNRSTNLSSTLGSAAAGTELWSFMPPEFYGSIKRLNTNTVQIQFDGTDSKPYGFDGSIVAHQDGTTAWIYASMRRGGRALYALDVSSPNAPTLKWKIGCPSNLVRGTTAIDTGCTTGFEGLGQAWATPKVFTAPGSDTPLLIVGGGYDPCEDSDVPTCTGSSKGKHIYVLNADTGERLKTLNTDRGVVADITIVKDNNGAAKYAYAADLGGNVYRITFSGSTAASWNMIKIASLGCDTVATCTANRKFMFAPDVVEESGTYLLLLGSGDREKPVSSYTTSNAVANYFFMIKDNPTDAEWLASEDTNCSASPSVICMASLLPIARNATATETSVSEKKGWALALNSTEQVVTSAITIYGVVTFSTHQPPIYATGTCKPNLGIANVYNLRYTNAASANGTSVPYQRIAGDGLPPSPVAGKVTLDDGRTVPFVIGANPESPLEAMIPEIVPSPVGARPKVRVYWHIAQ